MTGDERRLPAAGPRGSAARRWAGQALASLPLIGGLSWALSLGACLLLPTGFSDPPPPANQPPRILIDSLQPGPGAILVIRPSCTRLAFLAYVDDPDNDALYWRVFADYQYFPYLVRQGNVLARPQPAESAAIAFELNPANTLSATELVHGVNAHAIELLVADRPFTEDQDFRTVPADAQIDLYAWTIFLKEGSGTCDE